MIATDSEKLFVSQGFTQMIVLALNPPNLGLEDRKLSLLFLRIDVQLHRRRGKSIATEESEFTYFGENTLSDKCRILSIADVYCNKSFRVRSDDDEDSVSDGCA